MNLGSRFRFKFENFDDLLLDLREDKRRKKVEKEREIG